MCQRFGFRSRTWSSASGNADDESGDLARRYNRKTMVGGFSHLSASVKLLARFCLLRCSSPGFSLRWDFSIGAA